MAMMKELNIMGARQVDHAIQLRCVDCRRWFNANNIPADILQSWIAGDEAPRCEPCYRVREKYP